MMVPLFFSVTFPFFFIIIAVLGSVTASSFFPFLEATFQVRKHHTYMATAAAVIKDNNNNNDRA